MEETKLKPCPFCGGQGRIITKSWDLFLTAVYVECENCEARTGLVEGGSLKVERKLAIEQWNNRVFEKE